MENKSGLHPRNKHKTNYDFIVLTKSYPKLLPYIIKNKMGNESINFSDANAVIALNSALLKHFYEIGFWEIPQNYLCPPIPGRADYIHHMADLFKSKSSEITLLDIGVGANCIYPLIAYKEYNWKVVGSDIDQIAIDNANMIVSKNNLRDSIELRLQKSNKKIFENIIKQGENFSLCIANPPFNSSPSEAEEKRNLKNKNLKLKHDTSNFKGQSNELWCEGGEVAFITQMIMESFIYKNNIIWFSSLVSKQESLTTLYAELKKLPIKKIKTIDMAQGQKKSRILAWTYL